MWEEELIFLVPFRSQIFVRFGRLWDLVILLYFNAFILLYFNAISIDFYAVKCLTDDPGVFHFMPVPTMHNINPLKGCVLWVCHLSFRGDDLGVIMCLSSFFFLGHRRISRNFTSYVSLWQNSV